MEKYYFKIADIKFEVNIEKKYCRYYCNENYYPFFNKDFNSPNVSIDYIYMNIESYESVLPNTKWKKAGLAGKYYSEKDKLVFIANIYHHGIVLGEKLIVCSKNMKKIKVYFNVDILLDHFYLELMIAINTILAKNMTGVILHATGIMDIAMQRAYVFMGESGAGKSTIAKLIPQKSSGYKVLSDDRVVVKKEEAGFYVYGTPWVSDTKQKLNEFGKLEYFFFLYHGNHLYTEEENKISLKRKLISNIFDFPFWDRECTYNLFKLCDQMIDELCGFNLYFSLSSDFSSFFSEL